MRLSESSLAGNARTLVAVGMVSDRSMFFAMTAPAPRIGLTWSPSTILTGEASAAMVRFTGAGAAAGAGRVAGGAWPLLVVSAGAGGRGGLAGGGAATLV